MTTHYIPPCCCGDFTYRVNLDCHHHGEPHYSHERVGGHARVRLSPTQELAWRAYDRVLERIRNQDGEPVSSADLIALVRATAHEGTHLSHGSAWNLISRWLRTHPRVERTEKFMHGVGEGFGWRWRT